MLEEMRTIRVYGYFEVKFPEASVDVAKGRAKQMILDTVRDPNTGQPLFNVERLETVPPKDEKPSDVKSS